MRSETARLTVIRRALISVSDKVGLDALGKFLVEAGVEVLSTGGTAKALKKAGVAVKEVADETGFPEIMGGRVKTLHPNIHGGLLARRDVGADAKAMKDHGIRPIDLLVVNLYPFEATVAKGAGDDEAIENIDIGGPAMIRAAAKNHDFVTVVVDPADYDALIAEMKAGKGATGPAFRRRMAARAYARTAAYDAAVAGWLASHADDPFPPRFAFGGTLKEKLRYGENPHQQAAFYLGGPARPGVATARQLQGKELSFNNLNDTDAAFELAAEFADQPACVIVKHANPCGVALGKTLADVILEKKLLAEDKLLRLVAYIRGIPTVDLQNEVIDQNILTIIPEPVARKNSIVAYRLSGGDLEVAMLDPDDIQTVDFIKKTSGLRVL
ncbi:MAG: bifunctional phosphoribosylaminoimidazolecarboxamide formyltransferase/IMP cyclohydrolase, partial [Rhodospirillales bacterium]|nr:bifunctional phosphoribosylaminoimidazolecarboxamide formyltransferase/IMP cyclohydrolase [Rhodospirillales bacterium]